MIIVLGYDHAGIDGRFLDPICRNNTNPHRVSDDILRWHFRQTVLANMRGWVSLYSSMICKVPTW